MLFIANAWTELIGRRGISILENRYGRVVGNWLDEPWRLSRPNRKCIVLWAPSSSPEALTFSEVSVAQRVYAWILFPVAVLGWDLGKQDYLYQIDDCLRKDLNNCCSILYNSCFTKTILDKADIASKDGTLWVEWKGLSSFKDIRRLSNMHNRPIVHWNHQWRSDKNILGAIDGMVRLSQKFPDAHFVIGRCLDGVSDVSLAKEALKRLRNGASDNLHVMRSSKSYNDYCRFLKRVDISVSVSHEESFGLAILEAASSRCACVVPQRGSYSEVLPAAVVGESDNDVWERVEQLCDLLQEREQLATDCCQQAMAYDVSVRVPRLIQVLDAYS